MKILIVDDQRSARRLVRRLLASVAEASISEAASYDEAVACLDEGPPDLVLLDIRLSTTNDDRSGLDLLRVLRARHPQMAVVIVTGSSEIGAIRAAMRLGAQDYVLKDELSEELLVPIVLGLRERMMLKGEVLRLRARVDRTWGLSAMVGSSPGMERLRQRVRRVADADATVLIRGETGTGKERVARALHEMSSRRDLPFLAIHCAALPNALLESLIFGHEQGAVAGAVASVRGQLELAGAGTILFDDIAEMPLDLQTKLLRVLEDRRFRPLGSSTELPLTARVLAATSSDLEKRIAEGRFRQELFFRINVIVIEVPPLSERSADIPELVQAFAAELPRKIRFTDDAMAWLGRRSWTGNVRELRNVVERVSILAEQDLVTQRALESLASDHSQDIVVLLDRVAGTLLALPEYLGSKLDAIERAVLNRALQSCSGNKSAAARLVGIERKAFERHWEKLCEDQVAREESAPLSS